jgi:hypothetical protein
LTEGKTDLLQVSSKQRPPSGWSFPVGAEILSTAFSDVPHAAPKPLNFSHAEPYFLKDRRQRRREDLPLPVLEVTFTDRPDYTEPPTPRPLWTIRVGSVPSPLKQWVRACLVDVAFPRIRAWLLQSFPPAALEAGPQCRVLLQEEHRRLLWEHRSSHFARAIVEELTCV